MIITKLENYSLSSYKIHQIFLKNFFGKEKNGGKKIQHLYQRNEKNMYVLSETGGINNTEINITHLLDIIKVGDVFKGNIHFNFEKNKKINGKEKSIDTYNQFSDKNEIRDNLIRQFKESGFSGNFDFTYFNFIDKFNRNRFGIDVDFMTTDDFYIKCEDIDKFKKSIKYGVVGCGNKYCGMGLINIFYNLFIDRKL